MRRPMPKIDAAPTERHELPVSGQRYRNRSKALRVASLKRAGRLAGIRLRVVCKKLDPAEEHLLAEETLAGDVWSEY